MSFMFLIKKLMPTCRYVNISTFDLNNPGICNNEDEYLYVKRQIELNIRQKDFSVRLPWIIQDINNINISDISDINTDYIYVSSSIEFAHQLFEILENREPGLHVIQSHKVFLGDLNCK